MIITSLRRWSLGFYRMPSLWRRGGSSCRATFAWWWTKWSRRCQSSPHDPAKRPCCLCCPSVCKWTHTGLLRSCSQYKGYWVLGSGDADVFRGLLQKHTFFSCSHQWQHVTLSNWSIVSVQRYHWSQTVIGPWRWRRQQTAISPELHSLPELKASVQPSGVHELLYICIHSWWKLLER